MKPKTKVIGKSKDILPGNSLRKLLLGGTAPKENMPGLKSHHARKHAGQADRKVQPEERKYIDRKCEEGNQSGNIAERLLGRTVPPLERGKISPELQENLSAKNVQGSLLRKLPLRLADEDILSGDGKELLRSTIPPYKNVDNTVMNGARKSEVHRSSQENNSSGIICTGNEVVRGMRSDRKVMNKVWDDKKLNGCDMDALKSKNGKNENVQPTPNLKLKKKCSGSPVRKVMTGKDVRKCLTAHRKEIVSAKSQNQQVRKKIEVFEAFQGEKCWGQRLLRV